MKIGNTDVALYNAKQFNFRYEHMEMKNNNSEWVDGASIPYFARNHPGFISFTVTLDVKGHDREEIRDCCSDILSMLTGPVELELDGFTNKFTAILTGHSEDERSLRFYHLLKLTFQGYEHGMPSLIYGSSLVIVNNPGNIVSPGRITITPSANAASITLTGICRDSRSGTDIPVIIQSVTNGKVIILDGIDGFITEDGNIKEVNMWTLPTFMPGSNIVTCSNSNMALKIETLPIYV